MRFLDALWGVKPKSLVEPWRAAWPNALAVWSRFVQLSEPRFSITREDDDEMGLTESFAAIDLESHEVLISLSLVAEMGLGDFAVEILAHEIGHHVLAPGDLVDSARLSARLFRALPGLPQHIPLVSNLYTDLLINHRLERQAGLRMDGVFRVLKKDRDSPLWVFYMRTYEILWQLPRWTLTSKVDGIRLADLDRDAVLAAQAIRVHGRDWLSGAYFFGTLCYPWLVETYGTATVRDFEAIADTAVVKAGGTIPDGLGTVEPDESETPEGSGARGALPTVGDQAGRALRRSETQNSSGAPPPRYRDPGDYLAILRSIGVSVTDDELLCRYYREQALPHLVPFPQRLTKKVSDPLPTGLETWDATDPLDELDVFESATMSPVWVPGYTTVRRVIERDVGEDRAQKPLLVYVGVDCSGSMVNPKRAVSYPVVAGAIVALSALRAKSRVKVALSGEAPGLYAATKDFERSEQPVLQMLTSYLGTGYTFAIPRLLETFKDDAEHPTHIVLITDTDIFMMLEMDMKALEPGLDGWGIARRALHRARGGGTMVLHDAKGDKRIVRLQKEGWNVHCIAKQEDLVPFAAALARDLFAPSGAHKR